MRLENTSSTTSTATKTNLVFQNGPVKHIIIMKHFANKQISKQFTQICVIRLIVKPQCSRIVEIDCKFLGKAFTEDISGGRHFLFHDSVVFLLFGGCFQTLPGEGAATKVHEDVA